MLAGSSRRRYGCRRAPGSSSRARWFVAQRCGLTIHLSRTRFVAWLKCVAVPLSPLTDQQVAGRLNSGVRPLGATTIGGYAARLTQSLRLALGSQRWSGRRTPGSSRVVPSRLRLGSRTRLSGTVTNSCWQVRGGAGTVVLVLQAQAVAVVVPSLAAAA